MSYFVSILSGVRDIFLSGCPQVFPQLNIKFTNISEPHKSSIQRGESYIYMCVCVCVGVCKGLEKNLAI